MCFVLEDIPDHDLLVGGFPCQDYSVASTLSRSGGIEGKKGIHPKYGVTLLPLQVGCKTICEYGYTTSATKSTYLHHAAIYHHSEYWMNQYFSIMVSKKMQKSSVVQNKSVSLRSVIIAMML